MEMGVLVMVLLGYGRNDDRLGVWESGLDGETTTCYTPIL